jgi:hypothetical protein
VQLHAGAAQVLLVGYDGSASGPLAEMARSSGLLGGALVLSRDARADAPRVAVAIVDGDAPAVSGALASCAADNAMVQMLPLFEALARGGDDVVLHAGPGRALRVRIDATADAPRAHHALGDAVHG